VIINIELFLHKKTFFDALILLLCWYSCRERSSVETVVAAECTFILLCRKLYEETERDEVGKFCVQSQH